MFTQYLGFILSVSAKFGSIGIRCSGRLLIVKLRFFGCEMFL